MLDYKDYELIWNEQYLIGYKEEVIRYLKDNLINYIKQNFEEDTIKEEVERLYIVKNCKYENDDLIRVKFNDEEKSHLPNKPIAKVSVLVPYNNGFSGNDVLKYLN